MGSEGYSITWNDHPKNLVSVFGRFLDDETLVDCTIAAEGKCLKAHRLMLSACSCYFELLFSEEMKKEKVAVLEDITFEDLKSLIAFMYLGQVTVPKDRLQDFVRAAESLQIKGLPSDLVHHSQRGASQMSVVCGKEGLASHLSHKCKRYSAIGAESVGKKCENLKTSGIGGEQSRVERPSTCLQTDLSAENVFSHPLSNVESFSDSETDLFSTDESLMEPKVEVEMEDSSFSESEDGNSRTVTDLFTSATAGEENCNELTPVPGIVTTSYKRATSSPIQKNESNNANTKFSSVTTSISSSANTANRSSFGTNTTTKQSRRTMGDSSSCVEVQLAGQSIRDRTDVIPSEVSSHNESTVEPMHEVWVEDMRSWEGEEVMIEKDTAAIHNQETTNQDVDVACDNQSAVWSNITFTANAASCIVAQSDRKDVSAQGNKVQEPEMNERHKEQECESTDDSVRTVVNVIKSGEHGVIEIDEEGKEEHVCDGSFSDKSSLSEHKLNHMGEHSFQCDVCTKSFSQRSNLTVHKRKHTGERPFQCDVCTKSFKHKCTLILHKRTHTGERPFQCDVCKMTFGRVDHLIVHKRKHTGERPFECDICKMSFCQVANLIVHKRKHTGERPFQCDVCTMSFRYQSNLTVHKRKHTGERPFQCEVCERSFAERGKLTVHKRKHTGEHPFECDMCKRSFTGKNNLITHMRAHTDEHPS